MQAEAEIFPVGKHKKVAHAFPWLNPFSPRRHHAPNHAPAAAMNDDEDRPDTVAMTTNWVLRIVRQYRQIALMLACTGGAIIIFFTTLAAYGHIPDWLRSSASAIGCTLIIGGVMFKVASRMMLVRIRADDAVILAVREPSNINAVAIERLGTEFAQLRKAVASGWVDRLQPSPSGNLRVLRDGDRDKPR